MVEPRLDVALVWLAGHRCGIAGSRAFTEGAVVAVAPTTLRGALYFVVTAGMAARTP